MEDRLTAPARLLTPVGRQTSPTRPGKGVWNTGPPAWAGEGEVRDWASVPEFVNDVVDAQSSIRRRPVDWKVNPIWGDAWGSSVHSECQSKAYRGSDYEM